MPETITIVDYRAGNLTSVRLAVERLGHRAVVTSGPDEVFRASRLIFPGVGAAGAAMTSLKRLSLDRAVMEYVKTGRPLLGICLGAQIIMESSEEDGAECLGLVRGHVRLLRVPESAKIPHMGWNEVTQARPHPIWKGVPDRSEFYFVHSYAPEPLRPGAAIGVTDYHVRFVSALAEDNIVACQFHPERSGRIGQTVLDNFFHWKP